MTDHENEHYVVLLGRKEFLDLRASHAALVCAADAVSKSRVEKIAMGGLRVTTARASAMDQLDAALAHARALTGEDGDADAAKEGAK